MTDCHTDADLIALLRREAAAAGSAAEWGRRHDLSRGYLCDVLAGRRAVSARLAAALGYRPARLWERDA